MTSNTPKSQTRRRPGGVATEPTRPVALAPVPAPAPSSPSLKAADPRPPAPRGPSLSADDLSALASLDAADFAALLSGSLDVREKRLRPGDTVRGVVVRRGDRCVFIDLGGKSEGAMDVNELRGPDGDLHVEVGDELEGVVTELVDGIPQLARRLSGSAGRERLELAKDSGLPVEGRVIERNSGGFVVDISGVRAFCPASQIDLPGGADEAEPLGRTFTFRIQEIRGRDVVVSRRVLLEEERRKLAEATRASLAPGQSVEVTVRAVRPNGAVVDLGGVEGFIPRRELSWDVEAELSELVQPGQKLKARVTGLDGGRVGLSARDAAPAATRGSSSGSLGTLGDLLRQARKG